MWKLSGYALVLRRVGRSIFANFKRHPKGRDIVGRQASFEYAAALAVVPGQKSGAASGIVLTGLALSAAFGVTMTSELIETFGRGETANVTAYSIGSSLGVGQLSPG